MKVRKIQITVKPWSRVWKEEKVRARQLARSEKVPAARKETLYFDSVDELRQVLTDKRLELLRLIRSKKPSSIKELAATARRDFKNVNADVHLLARLGLVELPEEKSGPKRRGRKSPRVPYGSVSVEIPLV
jgi:predicted transcriptional regulator